MRHFRDLTFRGQARRLRPLAMKALRRFCIEARSVRQLTSASNYVFRVDTVREDRFALRLSAPRSCHTEENIGAEVSWLRAAAEDGIGLPLPVATPDGEYVFTLKAPDHRAEYPCTLFTWLPGRMLADCRTSTNVRRHGALQARLHEHAEKFQLPPDCRLREYNSPFPYSDPTAPVYEAIVILTEQDDLVPPARREVFERAHDQVREVIDFLYAEGEPRVIHNDLHVWNVLVHRNRLFALDFEDMLCGFPVQDVATTLFYYRYRDSWPARLDAFRDGYESVRPWPERRPGDMETLIAGRGLLLANYVAASDDADDRALAPKYLATIEDRLRGTI